MDKAENLSWLSSPIARHPDRVRRIVIGGLILVVVLSGLASLNPLIGVISSLLILLLAIIVPRPILIVYGLTLALPLTGGLARGAAIPFLRVSQALLVFGFIFLAIARPTRLGKTRLSAIDLAFVLFLLGEAVFPILALYFHGEGLNLTAIDPVYGDTSLQTLLGPVQYYLLYRIVVGAISSQKQVITILKLIFITSIIVSIIGILQELVPAVSRFILAYYPPVSDIYGRITSTLQFYSGLGAYLAFVLILALVCYTARTHVKIAPLLLAATFVFDSIALILTGTFAAWIGLVVGTLVVFVLMRRIPKPIIYIAIGVGLAALIFQPFLSTRLTDELGAGAAQGLLPQSFAFRIMLWKQIFLPAIGQNLLFGYGPSPAVLALWPAEESQYFLTLLRGGLIYFFSYLLLIAVSFYACWRQIKRKERDAGYYVATALFAILVALSVMNISGEYFTYVGGTQILWMLLAIVVATWQLKGLEQSEHEGVVQGVRGKIVPYMYNGLERGARIARPAIANGDNEPLWLAQQATVQGLVPDYNWAGSDHVAWIEQRFGKFRRFLDWRFLKDSVLVGAGSTLARILGLLFSTVLARFLVPDAYGYFRYVTTLAGIITIAASTYPNSFARSLAAHPEDEEELNRYFTNGIVGAILLLGITLLVSIPILQVLHALDIGAISCIIGLAGFYCYLGLARGLNSAWKMSLSYLVNNASMIVALIVVFGFLHIHTAMAAIVIWGLTYLAPLVMELFRSMPLRFRFHLISKHVLLELVRFAIPMIVSSGAFSIWYGIDIILVENLAPGAAGSYAAAKTLGQLYVFVPSAITLVMMPRVAAANLSKSLRYLALGVAVALLVSLTGFAIVDIWGQKIISLIFGRAFIGAYSPLVILSIGMCIASVNTILEGFLIGRGRPQLAAQAMIVAMVSTGVLGYWFVSWRGGVGASLAFTVGAALAALVMQYKTWRFVLKEGKTPAPEGEKAAAPELRQFMDVTDPALAAVTLKMPIQKARKSDREE